MDANSVTAERFKKYSAASVVWAVVGVVIAAAVFAFAYGPCEHYSPLVYLNLILAVGFGWLIGWVGKSYLRKFRIDNKGAAFLIGAAGGLAGLWFGWLSYLWVISGYDFSLYAAAMKEPGILADIMQLIAHDPLWSLGKSKSQAPAVMYYGVWIAEALIIVGTAIKVCTGYVAENRLCSMCGGWIEKDGDAVLLALPEDPAPVLAALGNGDMSVLASLARVGEEDSPMSWLEAECIACPRCEGEDCYATVKLVELKQKKKEVERNVKVLARNVRIDAATEHALFSEPAAKADAPAAEASGEVGA